MAGLRAIGAQAWFIGYPLDLLIAFRGKFYIQEVKVPGEKPSRKQRETIMLMQDCGCPVDVVYSLGDSLRAIGAIGPVD